MSRVSAAVAATAIALFGAALLVLASPADAAPQRVKAAVSEFKRLNPCPSTGEAQGACPGHVVAHVVPLCAEGEDAPDNLRWQPVAEAKEAGRWARQYCQFHRARAQEQSRV